MLLTTKPSPALYWLTLSVYFTKFKSPRRPTFGHVWEGFSGWFNRGRKSVGAAPFYGLGAQTEQGGSEPNLRWLGMDTV